MHFYKNCTDPNKKFVDTEESPFYNFCSCNSLFFFSLVQVYFLATHPALGCRVNKKRKKINENEAEAEIITWTAVKKS